MKPLCVDLDGTLVRTDLLLETFVLSLRYAPMKAMSAVLRLGDGKAAFKRRIAEAGAAHLSVERLPYNPTVISYLEEERQKGRRLELVSGSDQSLVDRVVAHLGFFDAGFGSDGHRNLTREAKSELLRQHHPSGFAYIGNDMADVAPLMAASEAVCANAPARLVSELNSRGKTVTEIAPRPSVLAAALQGMRLHQWGKNLLLFTSFGLSLGQQSLSSLLVMLLAFLAFGLVASATYLLNDLFDIESDRLHPTKRERPFASGRLPVAVGSVLIISGLLVGLGLAAAIGPPFLIATGVYILVTLAYSLMLKSVPVLDVLVLGLLFFIRVQAGAAAIGEVVTPWLGTFSLLFFSSLAFAKRYVEMVREGGGDSLMRRGYVGEDRSLALAFGAALAVASLLVFLLYAFSGESQAFSSVNATMVCFGVVAYWVIRIWFKAVRGELHDDPVVFAVKDKVSYATAAVILVVVVFDQWTR